jgi:adenosylcobinamide amidohydrolase
VPVSRLVSGALVVGFGGERRTLSSAVLGGGLGSARAWLNATVPADYARTDPEVDLAERARTLGVTSPVVGMLTAVDVAHHHEACHGSATAVATVGVRHALAAAGTRPRAVAAGTINLLVLVDAALTDAGLAGAAQTAVEAKAQALAATGVPATNAAGPATGTATDAFCIAALPGARVAFAGPATRVGGDIAHAVFAAVRAGALEERVAAPARGAVP